MLLLGYAPQWFKIDLSIQSNLSHRSETKLVEFQHRVLVSTIITIKYALKIKINVANIGPQWQSGYQVLFLITHCHFHVTLIPTSGCAEGLSQCDLVGEMGH